MEGYLKKVPGMILDGAVFPEGHEGHRISYRVLYKVSGCYYARCECRCECGVVLIVSEQFIYYLGPSLQERPLTNKLF